MDTFKLLKLKNYFSHLVLGTFVLLTGTGIIQSIVLEMIQEYDPASKTAYICGLIACGVIAFYGIYEILRAFYFEKHIFKNLFFIFNHSLSTFNVFMSAHKYDKF